MFPYALFETVSSFIPHSSSSSSTTMLEVGSSSGSKILSLPEAGTVVPPYEHPHHLLGLSAPLVPPGVSLEGYSSVVFPRNGWDSWDFRAGSELLFLVRVFIYS